jgi:hypothetical protein
MDGAWVLLQDVPEINLLMPCRPRLGLLLLKITSLRVKNPTIRGVATHDNRSRDGSGG